MNKPSKLLVTTFSIVAAFSLSAANPQPRGYTIPTLDLSDQKHRQVVVDREKGQYLGHPSTVLLEDGKTMLIVYPKGHGRGGIVYKRSTDGGKTWSKRLPTPASWVIFLMRSVGNHSPQNTALTYVTSGDWARRRM